MHTVTFTSTHVKVMTTQSLYIEGCNAWLCSIVQGEIYDGDWSFICTEL